MQAIANESTNGITRPIDVLILQEQDEPSTTTQAFVDLLNRHPWGRDLCPKHGCHASHYVDNIMNDRL
ncbi:MAG: hypothetical protein R3C45_13355 [Phycisphaerales bacterium]